MKFSDLATDAYPAEEPQAVSDRAQEDHSWDMSDDDSKEYKFVYAAGELEVSPAHDHQELAGHAGVEDDHRGPMAVGYVHVEGTDALWEVNSNVSLKALHRVLMEYTKHVGWHWGGMTGLDGDPISDDFAPKKSMHYKIEDGHLFLSRKGSFQKVAGSAVGGTGQIVKQGQNVTVYGAKGDDLTPFDEWATDEGLNLRYAEYPGGGDMSDHMVNHSPADGEDAETFNNSDMKDPDSNVFGENEDEREPSGLWRCPHCKRLFPNWGEYLIHRREEDPPGDQPTDGKFPDNDMGATFPTHFTEQMPHIMPISRNVWNVYQYGDKIGSLTISGENKLLRLDGYCQPAIVKLARISAQAPQDALSDPIPFVFDIEKDHISVGQPGTKTSDVPGEFTPGGIVEGDYEPGGKVMIRTQTNMPYSVRHMVELWYYTHPHFEVKSVYLQDNDGQMTKVANSQDLGGYISAMVASDPTAHTAAQALMKAGGHVHAVGGAVRDAVMGKEPKDIDLMVTGLPGNKVNDILDALPGRVDLTGKDFGVFRYRHFGNEVEIALPRRERSTGSGHKDFDVQADHKMTPEEDLQRRDFTANAMAVDLGNGRLIDPFGGAQDVGSRTLRALTESSLSEDPLRVVRALVAHSRHGLDPTDVTRAQMGASAGSLAHLPSERIQAELDKLMASKNPANGIRLAHETGVLGHILPEVDSAFDFDQRNPHHSHDLGSHLLHTLDGVTSQHADPDLRLAALMHDIGKPNSQWIDDDGVGHYYQHADGRGADHETLGSKMAIQRMNELRYPKDRTARVAHLIDSHMFPAFSSPKGARKFLNRVGDEHADDLLKLRQADMYGKGTDEYQNSKTPVTQMQNLVEGVRTAGEPTTQSNLAINGNDLIEMGVPAGPEIGEVLRNLTALVVSDPSQNNRDTLLQHAQGMIQ